MQLKKGKMSTKQLAEWMGINYNTFRNQKRKKLKVLQSFCDFEEVYGGVLIKEIYDPIYKDNIPDDNQIFLNEIKVARDGLSSVAGMSRKLQKNNDYYSNLSNRQVVRKMTKCNYTMFGKYNGQKEAVGQYGCRKYVYAIRLDIYNNYRKLTQEENVLFKHIVKSVCGNETEKIMEMMLLDQVFKNSDMTKQQYFLKRERFDLDLFPQILQQFKKETGYQIVRIQQYQLNGIKMSLREKVG